MGLILNRMREPVFYKEDNQATILLEKLLAIKQSLNDEGKRLIEQDIRCIQSGIEGEKNIAFELKNSHIPMYVLHDLYITYGDLSAQIDYYVITRKYNFIIECKNLYGNIEIDSNGNFIRTMKYGNRYVKEGIYSPITQNERHLALLKQKKIASKTLLIQKLMQDHWFEDFNKTIVVLANPKTILNDRYAKKEIKNQIIRVDQLVKYIKDTIDHSKESSLSDEDMLRKAEQLCSWNVPNPVDYTAKYQSYSQKEPTKDTKDVISGKTSIIKNKKYSTNKSNTYWKPKEVTKTAEKVYESIEHTPVYKDLRQYRLEMSRIESVKPYFIYNNSELEELIQKRPHTLQELEQVHGFGKVKADKYGVDIITIIKKYDYSTT